MHSSRSSGALPPASLRFPFPQPPEPGKALEIVPGVYWLSTYLPFRLKAVNLWLLRDGNGWTMIDCGFPLAEVRQQIESIWSGVLQGMPITRLLVTHHHPDHVGNCRWICERWGIVPGFTEREHRQSVELMDVRWQGRSAERIAFFRRHGMSAEIAAEMDRSLCMHRALFAIPPDRTNLLREGDVLRIGEIDWEILVAGGHSPAQALLYSRERNLLISGDQVLPQITPNVSVRFGDPGEHPLVHFLESNRRIARHCGDPLVLPSHKLPFLGLQARIQIIEHHHEQRLQLIERELQMGPRTAASLMAVLFGDPSRLTGHELHFALGESVAHLHHLVALGRAMAVEDPGETTFRTR